MFAYSNIIALVRSQLKTSEGSLKNISGTIDGNTYGFESLIPTGLSILDTETDSTGWNSSNSTVINAKIDSTKMFQFELDSNANDFYFRAWDEHVKSLVDSFDNVEFTNNNLTGTYTQDINAGTVVGRTFGPDYTFTGDFSYTAHIQGDNVGMRVRDNGSANDYAVWLFNSGGDLRVYSDKDGVTGNVVSIGTNIAYVRLERIGNTLYISYSLDNNTFTVFQTYSSAFVGSTYIRFDARPNTPTVYSTSGNDNGVSAIGGWGEWNKINDSQYIDTQSYGDITATTLQSVIQQINDNFASKIYVQAALDQLDWQESVLVFYDPTIQIPGSFSPGDRYVSTATANNWIENYVYEYDVNAMQFVETVPNEGFTLRNEQDDTIYTFNGSSWEALQTDGITWQVMDESTPTKNIFDDHGYIISAGAAPYSVLLPTTPNVGDEIYFLSDTGDFEVNPVTIDRQGNNIMSLAEDLNININEFSFSLVYQGVTNGWRIRE